MPIGPHWIWNSCQSESQANVMNGHHVASNMYLVAVAINLLCHMKHATTVSEDCDWSCVGVIVQCLVGCFDATCTLPKRTIARGKYLLSSPSATQICQPLACTSKMFAVPGWSVPSSALATQVDGSAGGPHGSANDPDRRDPTLPIKKTHKRKRGRDKAKADVVTGDNFAELWEEVIEGKSGTAVTAVNSTSKRDKKRQKRDKNRINDAQDGAPKAMEGQIESTSPRLSTKEKFEVRKVKEEKKRELLRQQQASGDAPPARPRAEDEDKNGTKRQRQPHGDVHSQQSETHNQPLPSPKTSQDNKLTPLQASMRQKLSAARFRHLNETLYTTPSSHSAQLFRENPEMFGDYHEGFRRQVDVWPENPVDSFVKELQRRGRRRTGGKGFRERHTSSDQEVRPLPRTDGTCTIADLGCGDAGLARSMEGSRKKLKLQILSYDLQSRSPFVTEADIAGLPLHDGSVDVAIFCLALMGTNWLDFVEEAFRVLRWRGELWVAEIKSRFGRVARGTVEHSVGNKVKKPQPKVPDEDVALDDEIDGQRAPKAETDVSVFVEVLRRRGFVLTAGEQSVDRTNKMFVRMHLIKASTPERGKCAPTGKTAGGEGTRAETWKKKQPKTKFLDRDDAGDFDEAAVLKPCVYKTR